MNLSYIPFLSTFTEIDIFGKKKKLSGIRISITLIFTPVN